MPRFEKIAAAKRRLSPIVLRILEFQCFHEMAWKFRWDPGPVLQDRRSCPPASNQTRLKIRIHDGFRSAARPTSAVGTRQSQTHETGQLFEKLYRDDKLGGPLSASWKGLGAGFRRLIGSRHCIYGGRIPMKRAPTMEEKTTVLAIRADKKSIRMMDALLLEYGLDTREGVLLMCLAEALTATPEL